jgi:tetratricopeptide (TPR) repeat protein/septum formation topological specificity factor MinE
MEHPNIARIVDAGETEQGQHYFAMELVNGPDLITFCNRNRLTIEERLNLFLDACSGVQHAHQKGVIHRDLKPSNVLVGEVDGQPQVKVIDFGLAKNVRDETQILSPNLPAESIGKEVTGHGRVLGSVWYMSPEQASLDSQQVDTRTDIYSLGVMLYQLLVDTTPLDKSVFANKPIREILEAIRSKNFEAPSERIQSASRLKIVLAARRTKRSVLDSQLREDLDWIVQRALKKNPDERYATVSELAADVQRFLNHEVVEARPVSQWYTLKKMARRHRVAVFSSAVLGMALMIGAGLATWGAMRIIKAESRSAAKSAQTKKANDILTDIFADLEIGTLEVSREPYKIRVAKRMIAAADLLDGESVDEPMDIAAMKLKLASSLLSLGFPREAADISNKAFVESSRIAGIQHQLTRDLGLVLAYSHLRSGDAGLAQKTLTPILLFCRDNLDEKNADWLRSNRLQARVWYANGENEKAVEVYERIVNIKEKLFGANDLETVISRRELADVLVSAKDHVRAIPMIKEVVKQCRDQLPVGHPQTIEAIASLGWAYGMSNNREAGIVHSDEAYEMALNIYGEHHAETYTAMQMRGLTAFSLNNLDQSEKYLSKAVKGLTETSGIDHPRTQMAIQILGRMYQQAGDLKRALPMMELTATLSRKKFADSPKILRYRLNELASVYRQCGYSEKARELHQECIELCDDQSSRESLLFVRDLGRAYLDNKMHDESIVCFQESLDGLVAISGQFDFDVVLTKVFLAIALGDQGNPEQAIELLRPYHEQLKNEFGAENRAAVLVSSQLALNLLEAGQPEETIERLEAAIESGVRLKRMDWSYQGLRKAYLEVFDMEKLYDLINWERESIRRELAPESKFMGLRLLALGREALDLGLKEKAEEILRESNSILANTNENSWEHRMSEFQLGRVQLAQGEIDVAIARLESTFEDFAKQVDDALPIEKQDLAKTIGQIEDLLEELSLEEELSKWRLRRLRNGEH